MSRYLGEVVSDEDDGFRGAQWPTQERGPAKNDGRLPFEHNQAIDGGGNPTVAATTKASAAIRGRAGNAASGACTHRSAESPSYPDGCRRDLRSADVSSQALTHLHELLFAKMPGEGSRATVAARATPASISTTFRDFGDRPARVYGEDTSCN